MVLASLLRATLIIAYQRFAADSEALIESRLLKFRLGILCAGVAWGSAGFLLFSGNNPQYLAFLVFALVTCSRLFVPVKT